MKPIKQPFYFALMLAVNSDDERRLVQAKQAAAGCRCPRMGNKPVTDLYSLELAACSPELLI